MNDPLATSVRLWDFFCVKSGHVPKAQSMHNWVTFLPNSFCLSGDTDKRTDACSTSMYLHSKSTQTLAFKKKTKTWKKNSPPPKKFFLHLIYATFQCRRYGVFKKNLTFFLTPKKWKNGPQKLLIIKTQPLFSQSSPDHSPELIFHIMKSRDQTSVLLSVSGDNAVLQFLRLFYPRDLGAIN